MSIVIGMYHDFSTIIVETTFSPSDPYAPHPFVMPTITHNKIKIPIRQ